MNIICKSEKSSIGIINAGRIVIALHLILTVIYMTISLVQFLLHPPHASEWHTQNEIRRFYVFAFIDVIICVFAVYNLFIMSLKDKKFIKHYKIFVIFLLLQAFLCYLFNHAYYIMFLGEFSWSILFGYIAYPLIGVGACYIFFWYCQHCRADFYHDSVGEMVIDDATQKKLKGIGGWLAIILVQLIVRLIYQAVCLFDFFDLSGETVVPITVPWGEGPDKGALHIFAVLNGVDTSLVFIAALLALLTLVRRASSFKKYYRLFSFSLFIFPLLFAGWCFWGSYTSFYHIPWGIIVLFFIWPLAVAFFSLPYLALSRRVRITLIN